MLFFVHVFLAGCLCNCVFTYVHDDVCIHIYNFVFIYVFSYVFIYVFAHVSIYVFAYVFICDVHRTLNRRGLWGTLGSLRVLSFASLSVSSLL